MVDVRLAVERPGIRFQLVVQLGVPAAVAAVDSGWALMPPLVQPSDWLPRAIRLMEALAATAFVYGVVLVRIVPRASDWFRAARNAAALVGAAALASLVGVLVLEGVWFDPRAGAPVTGFQIAEVAVVLVGLAAALISLAALPGRERRTLLVVVAVVVAMIASSSAA